MFTTMYHALPVRAAADFRSFAAVSTFLWTLSGKLLTYDGARVGAGHAPFAELVRLSRIGIADAPVIVHRGSSGLDGPVSDQSVGAIRMGYLIASLRSHKQRRQDR
jgi:hypothetical protein